MAGGRNRGNNDHTSSCRFSKRRHFNSFLSKESRIQVHLRPSVSETIFFQCWSGSVPVSAGPRPTNSRFLIPFASILMSSRSAELPETCDGWVVPLSLSLSSDCGGLGRDKTKDGRVVALPTRWRTLLAAAAQQGRDGQY